MSKFLTGKKHMSMITEVFHKDISFAEGIGKLLAAVGLENTENNRRRYRQLLFTSDKVSIVFLIFI